MFQTFSDLLVFLGWIWNYFFSIISSVFLPVRYIFTFLGSFVSKAFSPPVEPVGFWSFSTDILEVFNAIPLWNYLLIALVSGVSLIIVFYLIKTAQRS